MAKLCFGLVLFIVSTFCGRIDAAEVEINGRKIQSRITVNEYACDGYSILIKEDQFPNELEDEIARSLAQLPVFYGDSITVGVTAFVEKDGVEHPIPDVSKKYQKNGKLLNDGRVYFPSIGYCLNKNSFLLSVWSGGNCRKCELLIRYQLDLRGRIVRVGAPSHREWLRTMDGPIPQATKHR